MSGYLIGFDIGTLSAKAVLTDTQGNVIDRYQKEHAIDVKHPGWQEESMDMWWREFKEAVSRFLSRKDVEKGQIKAVAATGLIPAMCPVDRAGNTVRNAILHTDVRAEKELQEINEKLHVTISHGHMMPKVLWVKKNEPDMYAKICKIMVPHGYIAYKLTGEATIDYDSATMMGGIFDENTLSWKREAIRMLGLEETYLPKPCAANEVIGHVSGECARETGLSQDTKVITGVGDTFCSMLGGGAYDAGHFMIYLGTSGTSMYAEGSPKEYMDIPHYGEGKGHFAGKIFSFGESILHLRSNLRYDSWDELDGQLDKIAPGSDGLWYVPHYKLQTDKSFFGPDAEFMLGYRGCHSQFHMYRAMLEGIAYNARYNVTHFPLDISRINIFGGGANSRKVCQIFADVIGRELYHSEKSGTAFGAAFLAGYGSGEIGDYRELTEKWLGDSTVIRPVKENVEIYRKLYEKYEDIRSRLMQMDRDYAG